MAAPHSVEAGSALAPHSLLAGSGAPHSSEAAATIPKPEAGATGAAVVSAPHWKDNSWENFS